MTKRLKNIYNLYPTGFWALTAAIILLAAAIFYLANFSNLSPQIVLEECREDSERVSEHLSGAERTFGLCTGILTEFADEIGASGVFVRDMDTVLGQFVRSSELTVGYFYKVERTTPTPEYEVYSTGDEKYHISRLTDPASIGEIERRCKDSQEPFWINLHNYMSDVVYLSYISPLYKNGAYIGFAGVNLDLEYLRGCFADSEDYYFGMLVSEDYQVLVHPHEATGTNLTQIDNGAYYGVYRALYDGATEGYSVQQLDGRDWVLAYTVLPTRQVYITSTYRAFTSATANYLTLFITFLAIACLFMIQTNKKTGRTPFYTLSDFALKRSIGKMSAPDIIRKRAALALYFGMAVSVFANGAFTFMTRGLDTVTLIHLVLLLAIVVVFLVYLLRRDPVQLFVLVTLVAPLVISLYSGGFTSGATGSLLLWISMSCVIAMLVFDAQTGERVFYLFVGLLFLYVLAEIYLLRNNDYYRVFTFVTALFLLGFANFTSMSLFTTLSEKDYNESVRLLEELRHTQSQLVQREKMVTLGRLIAGIAHEINTPVGAIKASAEVLDSSLNAMVTALIVDSRKFSDADYERLLTLIDVAKSSAEQMRSTMEVRRAKTLLREFFAERGLANGNFIADTLASMEICDLEWVRANAEVFASENSTGVLQVLKKLSPIINGAQTIGIASEKISKIVFSLRSYAHTNVSEDRTLFNLTGTIDNVLVLCHHQLKQGVEVIKYYDENLPEVEGNPDELGQVWTNLIQNAISAMGGVGKLTVSVRLEDAGITVRIADTGTGVPEEIRERIFEPFYTTKPLGEGSGLGLDICRKIVFNHGGELTLEENGPDGATFRVRLPVVKV